MGTEGRTIVRQWGATGDVPVAADYDRDGAADISVYRPSTGQWFVVRSGGGGTSVQQWGGSADIPVVAPR